MNLWSDPPKTLQENQFWGTPSKLFLIAFLVDQILRFWKRVSTLREAFLALSRHFKALIWASNLSILSDKALAINFFIRGLLEKSSCENSNSPGPLATLLKPWERSFAINSVTFLPKTEEYLWRMLLRSFFKSHTTKLLLLLLLHEMIWSDERSSMIWYNWM